MNIKELEKLVDDYGDYIYGFCFKLTLDKIKADELYQNTFLKAVEVKERINNETAKSYIIGISIKIFKAQKRKEAIRKEEHTQVAQIVYSMNDKIKIPMLMYYNLEMNIEEISNILNIPKGTVKSRLSRGREIIKNYMLEVNSYE